MNGLMKKIEDRMLFLKTNLCAGLDPDISYFQSPTEDSIFLWAKSIIDDSEKYVCCYKVNYAFFQQFDIQGLRAMKSIIKYAKSKAPVIIDSKVSDIGNTCMAYAKAMSDVWMADCVTFNPYMSLESVKHFLDNKCGVFVLTKTSNDSFIQNKVYLNIVKNTLNKYKESDIGFVVGGNKLKYIKSIRRLSSNCFLLCPGIGNQGGKLFDILDSAWGNYGRVIVPSSRMIAESSDRISLLESLVKENRKFY